MADTQGSWSFKDVTKSGVTSRTGTYKIGTTTVAEITGLSPTVKEDNITINTTNKTIQLSASAFGTSNVKLTKGNYTLGFLGDVPGMNGIEITGPIVNKVQLPNPTMTVSKGTVTVTGTLEKGYTLAANKKSITYSARKENATLATIQGLDTSLVNGTDDNAGKVGTSVTEGETTTFTEAVKLDGNTITLTQAALKDGKVTFKTNAGGYTFALSGVTAPKVEDGGDGWTVSGTTAKYKGNLAAGHTLSLDGKTVNYTGNQENKVLITVSGITKNLANVDTNIQVKDLTTADSRYAARVVLSKDALATSDITVTAGYKLELNSTDTNISKDPEAKANIWAAKNKTIAVYKQVTPAYYSYDEDANKILYNKQADIQTYATISGLKSGFTVDDGVITGIALGSVDDTTGEFEEAKSDENATAKVIQLTGGGDDGILATSGKATLTGEGYKLLLDADTDNPGVESNSEIWSTSGTTATLKGNITAGWTQTDDNTITYVKKAQNGTIATIKGLGKGILVNDKKAGNFVATKEIVIDETTGEPEIDETTNKVKTELVQGLERDNESGKIIVAANVLGTTNVTLTPATGITSTLVLDDEDDNTIQGGGGKVTTTAEEGTFWEVNGASLNLKNGEEAYYTLKDSNTINYTAAAPNKTIATIKGLKTDLKVDSNYDISGITVDNDSLTITADKSVLNGKNVSFSSNTNGYTFKLDTNVDKPTTANLWTVVDKVAYLKTYETAGYKLGSGSTSITYSAQHSTGDLAEIKGLKNGIKAVNGKITGITIGGVEEVDGVNTFVESDTGTEIQLAKGVLGTTDVVLTNAKGKTYTLALAAGEIEKKYTWSASDVKNVGGQVTCKVDTPAGFVLDSTSTTATYNKKSTVNVVIKGLKARSELTIDATEGVTGINLDKETGVITLGDSVLNEKNVTLTGNGYTLALDAPDDNAPTFTADKWTTKPTKNVTTATLNGTVSEAGYQASADGKTINYIAVPENGGETVVLATITGLNGNVKAKSDGTIEGITADNATMPTKFTLTTDVLGTSKVAVSGGNYKLVLDEGVPQAVDPGVTEWVTSGTTATYKTFDKGYYTLDDTGSSIAYTADTKGTTIATVKGIKSGVDVNSVFTKGTKTLTLNAAQLGTSKVTITGTGFIVKLGDAPTEAKNKQEWVTSGTTASFKNYMAGYYKQAGNTAINYTAATKGSTIATVKGIVSGSTITDTNKVVTLTADQLGTSKVTITGDGYTLALGAGVKNAVNDIAYSWTTATTTSKGVTTTTATYSQTTPEGYTLANDAKSITYAKNDTTKTLATITGLAETLNTTKEDEVITAISGITVGTTKNDDGKYSLTLTDASLIPSKVTLTSTDYVLAMDNENVKAPAQTAKVDESGNPIPWTVKRNNGTVTYNATMSEGFSLATNAKNITKIAETNKTLFTVSGLNKTAINKLFENEESTVKTLDVGSLDGFTVNTEEQTITLGADAETEGYLTKKVTLGKNDDFTFVLGGVTEPTAYTNPKWTVSTVKGTTKAVLKNGMEAGYELTNGNKNVVLTAEKAGDAVATLTGLVKGLTVSTSDPKVLVFKNSDNTYSNAVSYDGSKSISLYQKSLGTSDITLESNAGYSIGTMNGIAPYLHDAEWTFKSGKATYSQVQDAGYTLAKDGMSVDYTAAKTTTIATISGLDKNFDEDPNQYLTVNNSTNEVTVKKGILGTSKATISVPKNSTAYKFKLDSTVKEEAVLKEAQWVINGTTATYKDYNDAYYLLASGDKVINYYKPKDVKTYVTIKGLASGADISSAFSGDTKGGTITLDSTMVGTTDIISSNANFKLKLDTTGTNKVETNPERTETSGWVTSGTTASYMENYLPPYYTESTDVKITCTKGSTTTPSATIKGVKAKLTAVSLEGTTFNVRGTQLSNKITVDGGTEYGFKFIGYNGAITGSKNADSIEAAGSNMSISTGDGNDNITITGTGVSVTSGAGDDTINATGSDGSNLFIFAQKQGADTITGFQSTDAIKTTSGTAKIGKWEADDDIVIWFGSSADNGSITLEDAGNLSSITINGKSVDKPETESEDLFTDDNYATNAAQLSEIVSPFETSFTPYDFNTNFSLTKEESYIPQISYAKDK